MRAVKMLRLKLLTLGFAVTGAATMGYVAYRLVYVGEIVLDWRAAVAGVVGLLWLACIYLDRE